MENNVGVLDGAGSLIWYSLTSNSAPQLWNTFTSTMLDCDPERRKYTPHVLNEDHQQFNRRLLKVHDGITVAVCSFLWPETWVMC